MIPRAIKRRPKVGIPGLPKRPEPKPRFSASAAFAFAEAVLAAPPARATIRREASQGELVARFALPLRLCQTTNSTRHGSPRVLGRTKSNCMMMMRSQLPTLPKCPLSGRPQVRCIRFSSVRPDRYSDGAKIPVDCLVKLGLIRNDDEESIDLFQWSEFAKPGSGCVIIEVWSGA